VPQPTDPLQEAVNAEKAASLGLSARKLRTPLDALCSFDENVATHSTVSRETLAAHAAEACWAFMVQRELIGLGVEDSQYVREQYQVPDEVWKQLGPKIG
jgi:hypothetical protein